MGCTNSKRNSQKDFVSKSLKVPQEEVTLIPQEEVIQEEYDIYDEKYKKYDYNPIGQRIRKNFHYFFVKSIWDKYNKDVKSSSDDLILSSILLNLEKQEDLPLEYCVTLTKNDHSWAVYLNRSLSTNELEIFRKYSINYSVIHKDLW